MRLAIVPFFRYDADEATKGLLYDFFLLQAKQWSCFVDRILVIDSGCQLTKKIDKLEIFTKGPDSHWENMNQAIRISPEDEIVLLDSDMVIYDPMVIARGFEDLKEYDCVGIFDGSGGVDMNKYEIMRENENRFERRRFCPYLFFLNRSALRPNFDFTPRGGDLWTDSMGTITEQVLEDGKRVKELQDDRATISLEDDGGITSCQWLDSPPKKWALDEDPNLGYYHIRNFGGGLKFLIGEPFGAVPGREARRLLAWATVVAKRVGYTNIPPLDPTYLLKFQAYHHWLENI